AYFQLYIEYEDGKPYTNFTIINQLFNLPTTKEKVYEATGVDIESVEESMQQEISMNELDEEVKTINVSRNDNSHLYTISFNLGDEGDNLTVARYYYDLIFNKETDFFSNKIPYVFVEPSITKNIKDAENEKELVEEENIQPKASSQGIILGIVINLIIGFLFGGILIIGILLLIVLLTLMLSSHLIMMSLQTIYLVYMIMLLEMKIILFNIYQHHSVKTKLVSQK